MDRFDRAEQLRQGILDFLLANPHSNTRAVANRFNMSAEYTYEVMRGMTRAGEIEPHGKNNARTWLAAEETTMPASVMREAVKEGARLARSLDKVRDRKIKPIEQAKKSEPGIFRSCEFRNPHTCSPYKDQGGQGALRREFGIQASAGMV